MNTQPWEFIVLAGEALVHYRLTVLEWLETPQVSAELFNTDGNLDEREIGTSILPRRLLDRKRKHLKRLSDHLAGLGLKLKDVFNTTFCGHNAPALIMVIGDRVNRQHRRGLEVQQALAAAIQNMLLAAHAMGYGACWIGDMMRFGEKLHRYLDLEPEKELVGGVTIGKPMENLDLKQVPKLPVEGMIRWRGL